MPFALQECVHKGETTKNRKKEVIIRERQFGDIQNYGGA